MILLCSYTCSPYAPAGIRVGFYSKRWLAKTMTNTLQIFNLYFSDYNRQ
jgi:hypothetical protein